MSAPRPAPGRPPRLAQRLISWLLPAAESEALLGDLEETFALRSNRRGRRRAMVWYWGQVAAAPVRVALESRRLRPGSPAAARSRGRAGTLESCLGDLRLGVRRAAQRPLSLFSAVIVLSLAVGGSTALVAALLGYSRWDPGLPAPQEISALALQRREQTTSRFASDEVARITGAMPETRIAAVAHRFVVARTDGGAATVWSGVATPSLFDTIGARLARGRTFSATDNEIVVSPRYWRERLDGREDVLGAVVWINSVPFTVVGVTAPSFDGLAGRPSLWMPFGAVPASERDALSVVVLACRCDHPDLDAAAPRIAAVLTSPDDDPRIDAATWIPAADVWVPRGESSMVDRANLTVVTLALLLLATACANVANILLADGLSRNSEMAVRAAIGADRSRLLRQLLAESAVLALAVCGGGYAVAKAFLAAVPLWLPTPMPGFEQHLELPFDVLFAGLGLALAATLAASLFPALRLTVFSGSGVAVRRPNDGRGRVLGWLGGVQVAAAAALMLIALFLTQGMSGVHDQPLGYQEGERYSFTLDASALPAEPDARAAAYRRFFSALRAVPGVVGVGVAGMVPGFLGPWESAHGGNLEAAVATAVLDVGPGYLEAAGTRLLEGRAFRDDDAGREVALVTQSLAVSLWGAAGALGKTVNVGAEEKVLRVVGVVEDGTYAGGSLLPVILRPLPAPSGARAFVVVHARNGIADLNAAIHAAMQATHADLSMFSLAPVSEWFDRHWVLQRAVGAGLRALAMLSLVISAIGVYAGFATIVTRRRREIGVRLSLGASPARLLRWVLGYTAGVAACGYACGVLLAAAGSRLVEAYLFDAGPWNPYPYGLGIVLTLLVAEAAALMPALRAAQIDPMLSLRLE